MEVHTIGFTKKTAAEFFGALKRAGIRRVIDVRLNNTSQLSGFAKRADLEFFLREICGAEYIHMPILAPTQDMLSAYRRRRIAWADYEREFLRLMAERGIENHIRPGQFDAPTALLCSEASADRCHRRLVLEYLQTKWGKFKIVDL